MAPTDSKPVVVKMLKSAKGYTRHSGAPRLVEFERDEEPIISWDLAKLWVASGTCKLLRATAEEANEARVAVKALKADQAKQEQNVKAAKARSKSKGKPEK